MTELQTRAYDAFTRLAAAGFETQIDMSSNGNNYVWLYFRSNNPLHKMQVEDLKYNTFSGADEADKRVDEYLRGVKNGN